MHKANKQMYLLGTGNTFCLLLSQLFNKAFSKLYNTSVEHVNSLVCLNKLKKAQYIA